MQRLQMRRDFASIVRDRPNERGNEQMNENSCQNAYISVVGCGYLSMITQWRHLSSGAEARVYGG